MSSGYFRVLAVIRESRHDQPIDLVLIDRAPDSFQIALIVVAKVGVIRNQPFIKGVPDLLDAIAQGVTGPEAGSTHQLVEIDAVVPAICIVDVFDPDVGVG